MRVILILSAGLTLMAGASQAQKVEFKAKDLKQCESAESPEQAIRSCTRLISVGLTLSPVFYSRGRAYSKNGDYGRAILDFDQAIRLEPSNVAAVYERGWAHHDNGAYDLAIQDFDQAVNLKPDSSEPLYSRGTAYHDKGEYDRAIQDYDRAIQIKPDHAKAFHNRGNAYRDKGDYKRAIQDYDHAIQIQPDYAKAFHNRGIAQFLQGQFAAAATDFAKHVDLTPHQRYPAIWLYIARARAGQNADEDLREAKSLDVKSWPGPAVALYGGMLEPKKMPEAAANSDGETQKGQLCEAHFFLGEYDLIHGFQDQAAGEFQAAADICRTQHECSFIAKVELRRVPHP